MVSLRSVSMGLQRGVTPGAWTAIKEMQRSLEIRGYAHYDKMDDPYRPYTPDYLTDVKIPEAKRDLRSVWADLASFEHAPRLFQEPYAWSEDGLSIKRPDAGYPFFPPLLPNEQTVQLLVLLSETSLYFHPAYSISKSLISKTFQMLDFGPCSGEVDKGQLVEVLHLEALERLVNSLGGEQLAELLYKVSKYEERNPIRHGLIEKLAGVFGEDEITHLAGHLATTPSPILSPIHRLCEAGQKAKEVAMQLFRKFEQMAEALRKTVEYERTAGWLQFPDLKPTAQNP